MYRHILVPLDGSALAEQVLRHAQAMADRSLTRITLLRVVTQINAASLEHAERSSVVLEELAAIEMDAECYMERIAARLKAEGYLVTTRIIHNTYPEDAIVDYAAQHGVDLITIATHGRSGVRRWLFGSVTQKVITATPAPILVVRPKIEV